MDLRHLEEIPLMDTHVHRFHPNRAGNFTAVAGGSIAGPDQQEHARQTILYGMVIDALRQQYGMAAETRMEQVERERERRYSENPLQYAKDLLQQQNVSRYCLEIGSPLAAPAYTEQEIWEFHTVIPQEKTCDIIRIERVAEAVDATQYSFSGYLVQLDAALHREIDAHRTIALKTVCAYTGGLAIGIVGEKDAAQAFERWKLVPDDVRAAKCVRDYVLMHSAQIAAELELPLQIHTGAGGGSWLDYKTQNPVHLIDFLKDPRVLNRTKIVLLHGGHPYEEETGYLVSQFSNVYSDFSGTFYLCSIKAHERMQALMEKAPLDKLMYGSDGVGIPEISWFAYRRFRQLMPQVLEDICRSGCLNSSRLEHVYRMIAYKNALACYSKLGTYLNEQEKEALI